MKKKTFEKFTCGGLLLLLFMFGVVFGVKVEERRGVIVAQEVAAAELEAVEHCEPEPAPELTPVQIAKRVKANATTDSGTNRVSIGRYETTAYCACVKCCGKTDGITASGVKATAGRTIAADTSLPFGAEVYINGHKYTVEDRGGAIKGKKKIDIYFDSHAEAIEYGRKTIEVFMDKQG